MPCSSLQGWEGVEKGWAAQGGGREASASRQGNRARSGCKRRPGVPSRRRTRSARRWARATPTTRRRRCRPPRAAAARPRPRPRRRGLTRATRTAGRRPRRWGRRARRCAPTRTPPRGPWGPRSGGRGWRRLWGGLRAAAAEWPRRGGAAHLWDARARAAAAGKLEAVVRALQAAAAGRHAPLRQRRAAVRAAILEHAPAGGGAVVPGHVAVAQHLDGAVGAARVEVGEWQEGPPVLGPREGAVGRRRGRRGVGGGDGRRRGACRDRGRSSGRAGGLRRRRRRRRRGARHRAARGEPQRGGAGAGADAEQSHRRRRVARPGRGRRGLGARLHRSGHAGSAWARRGA
jgi:hypothetical protein